MNDMNDEPAWDSKPLARMMTLKVELSACSNLIISADNKHTLGWQALFTQELPARGIYFSCYHQTVPHKAIKCHLSLYCYC